ncbi:MAG: hypothetical protein IKM46_04405 [Clostridia bacterium]|nr:hypothetical protein [Clostridia bacterium]
MYKSTVANVFSVIGAVILCIVLTFSTLATLSVTALTSFLNPSNLVDMIFENEDTVDSLIDEAVKEMDIEGINDDFIDDIVDSDIFEDALADFSEELSENLFEDSDQNLIDKKFIKKFIKKNVDEIAELYVDNMDTDMTKSEVEDAILDEIDEISEEFAAEMPTTGEIFEDVDSETMDILKYVLGGSLAVTMIIVTVVIAALLYLLRHKYLGGLKWIGSSGIASAALIGLTVFTLNLLKAEFDIEKAAEPLFDMIVSTLSTTAIITFAVSLVLILVGCIVGKMLKNRKERKAVPAVVNGPAPAMNMGYTVPVQETVPTAPVQEENNSAPVQEEKDCDYDIGAMNSEENAAAPAETDNTDNGSVNE